MEFDESLKYEILVNHYFDFISRKKSEVIENLESVIKEKRRYLKKKKKNLPVTEPEKDHTEFKKLSVDIASWLKNWQEQSISDLGGLTPIQIFDSIESVPELIFVTSLFMNEDASRIPDYLIEKIRKIDSKYIPFLIDDVADIQPTEALDDNRFTMTLLHIVYILALPEFIPSTVNVLCNPSFIPSGEIVYTFAQKVLINFGEESLVPLISALDQPKSDMDKTFENRIMDTIVPIMKDHKSDQYFEWLKDRFRKADDYHKTMMADYLATYGDSRSVTLLRGYVERKKNDMSVDVYRIYRKAIRSLGGNAVDLDRYFDFDFDEEDEN